MDEEALGSIPSTTTTKKKKHNKAVFLDSPIAIAWPIDTDCLGKQDWNANLNLTHSRFLILYTNQLVFKWFKTTLLSGPNYFECCC